MSTETIAAGLWEIEETAYHADLEHVSHSRMEDFRKSVGLYAGRYVHKTLPLPEPTDAMRLGSALHCLVLEPERFNERYIVPTTEKPDGRTKAGKAWQADFDQLAAGRTILTIEQSTLVHGMAEGISRNAEAAALIERCCHREQAIRWQCPWTDLACKAKLDGIDREDGIILDVKTALDPSPQAFARSCATFGYMRQDPWYRYGARHAIEDIEWEFLFIVVGNQPPHECVVCQLEPAAVAQGAAQNERDIIDLKVCVETGDWSGRHSRGIQTITLPKWAQYE